MRRLAEVDSTNREALDLARAGAPEGLVVVAGSQTAGRGRHGRSWESAPGASLLLSVLLRPGPSLPAGHRHLAVAAVALAARDACRSVAGFAPDIKWPNDLVVDDAKLAGVLAEVDGDAVVVGLGLNVSAVAPWPAGAVAAEAVAGRPVDAGALLAAVLESLAGRAGDWNAVPSEYRAACATLGRTVRVDLQDESFTGTAADVTDDGRLLVDVGVCLREVTAGDVVHLRPVLGAR